MISFISVAFLCALRIPYNLAQNEYMIEHKSFIRSCLSSSDSLMTTISPIIQFVGTVGLEPTYLSASDPKSLVSTNSTIFR